jgi:UDP-N-acetylmuramate dehydrogenase
MDIRYDVSLKPYHTFGIEVQAQAFVEVGTFSDLHSAIDHACAFEKTLVLGGGSNVLFTQHFAGLIIRIALRGIHIVEETDSTVVIEAAAGEPWDALVQHCVAQNWSGIENLSLIPGSVGAAPVQNIGAYGVELKDSLVSVQGIMRRTGEERTLTNKDCLFGYRDSIFKHDDTNKIQNEQQGLRDRFIITSVRLKLAKNPAPEQLQTRYGAIEQELSHVPLEQRTVRDVSEAVRRIRRSKLPDPAQIGNAGSFFKNPLVPVSHFERVRAEHPTVPSFPANDGFVKIPAGWLIEQCGWKGKRVGATGSHAQQALVLVNYGAASGSEVFALAQNIQASVAERFGVQLSMEVNIL